MYSETSGGRRESDIAIGSRKQTVPLAPAKSRIMVSGSSAWVLPPKTPATACNRAKSDPLTLFATVARFFRCRIETGPMYCCEMDVVCCVRENWNRRCTIKFGGWTDEEKI